MARAVKANAATTRAGWLRESCNRRSLQLSFHRFSWPFFGQLLVAKILPCKALPARQRWGGHKSFAPNLWCGGGLAQHFPTGRGECPGPRPSFAPGAKRHVHPNPRKRSLHHPDPGLLPLRFLHQAGDRAAGFAAAANLESIFGARCKTCTPALQQRLHLASPVALSLTCACSHTRDAVPRWLILGAEPFGAS